MKLIETDDWKAVHLKDRTILRTDRNLYPDLTWWALISTIEVQPTDVKGHYIVIRQEGI